MEKFLVLLFIVWNIEINAKPTTLKRAERNALRDKAYLWPQGIVPYAFDEAFTPDETELIESAMEDIQLSSCIRFIERSYERGYLSIEWGDECSATVGYSGVKQKVILGDVCFTKSIILHELMHALGFFHEHTRPDRDEHVIVHHRNIHKDELYNFEKKDPSEVTTLDLPYDYYSILHYVNNTLAIDTDRVSLQPRKKGIKNMGLGVALTSLDVKKINKLYECGMQKATESQNPSPKPRRGWQIPWKQHH